MHMHFSEGLQRYHHFILNGNGISPFSMLDISSAPIITTGFVVAAHGFLDTAKPK